MQKFFHISFSYILCNFIHHYCKQKRTKNRILVDSCFYFKFFWLFTINFHRCFNSFVHFCYGEGQWLLFPSYFSSEPTKSPFLTQSNAFSKFTKTIHNVSAFRHEPHLHFIYLYHISQLLLKYLSITFMPCPLQLPHFIFLSFVD